MRFHALGPISVTRDGQAVDLGANKQKALLALLLINANTIVSTEQILESLWDSEEASSRKAALRVYISRLRAVLDPERVRGGPSILQTKEPGYMLEVNPHHFDVTRFLELSEEARALSDTNPGSASQRFADALALWQGSAYEEFQYDDFAHAESNRLNDARISAIEGRIAADLAVGRAGELVSELELLRDQHPLREGLVGSQMIALYRAGRPADALRAMARFRSHLGDELGIDPSPPLLRLEEQILLHDERIQVDAAEDLDVVRPINAINPYKGLKPFDSGDASTFFGRDALIADMLRSVGSGESLIALVGASGSGKSSVVRAGLIPALAKGAVTGSDQWLIASMTPGGHPFAELEAALLRTTINAPESLTEQLDDPDTGILRSVLRVLPEEDSRLVLVIDQFEELFILVEDAETRRRFLSNLVTAIEDPLRRLTVVLTLRADFYAQPLEHPRFGARLGNGIINVTALTSEELEAAAARPAQEVGVQLEPALVGQIIADVGNQPGALPLFQYALTELFDRRSSDFLTVSAYRAMGGLKGALKRRADDLFENLTAEEQDATRQLFLRLVAVSEHDQRSRRRVAAREITSLGIDTVTMQSAISQLGEHRLLSFDSDRLSGAPTVEVAHESLLTAWPKLEEWIDESRDDLRRHASLVVAMREWELADRASAYLLPVGRLAEYRNWAQNTNLRLNAAERGYLDASEAVLEAEKAGREFERRRAQRARRRLWSLIAALCGSLAVAGLVIAGVFAPDPGPTVTFFGQENPDRTGDSIRAGVERAEQDFEMVMDDARWTVRLDSEFDALVETKSPEIVITDASALFVPEIFVNHPEIQFGLIDPTGDWDYGLTNITSVGFRNEEGAFLAGVAAASVSQTGTIGFVGAQRIALIEEFRAGFEAGALAVDPDIEILATFVAQTGDNGNGFGNVNGGDARASALYQRGADVVFHAAALSGQGIFAAAERYSETSGTHVWGIGVDVDQWFDVPPVQRDHVLTSMIKRQDEAAYRIAEHLIAGRPSGEIARLGLAEDGYAYATSGNHLPTPVIEALDRFTADVAEGRRSVPVQPSGPVLILDFDGNELSAPEQVNLRGIEFTEFSAVEPGSYELTSLGTPVGVEIVGDWFVQINMLGHTAFTHPDSLQPGDRDISFFRPRLLSDPTDPGAALGDQVVIGQSGALTAASLISWLDRIVDGVVSSEPVSVELAGRDAIYFEAEITDDTVCGNNGYCAGFIVNDVTPELAISGWSFEPGFHQRIWVVDGGPHPPLVIVTATPADDRSFHAEVDAFLDRITIGDPQPHPIPGEIALGRAPEQPDTAVDN